MSEARWQVVLVRPPEAGIEALAELLPEREIGEFPFVLRPRSEAEAQGLAERLRAAGVEVVVAREVEDRQEVRDRRRWRRTRQMAWMLLLAVVIFKVFELRDAREAALFGGRTVDVGVMQFAAPGDQGAEILARLNDGASLPELERWFNEEYRRYTGSTKDWIELEVGGPWGVPLEPPRLDREMPTLSRAARSISYVWWWEALARDQGVDPESYAVRLYVAFLPADGDAAADSRGDPKRRTAVAHVDVGEENLAYVQTTLAHELAHALGATDRYDPVSFLAEYPEGYVEPFESPLFPQRYAELMAVDRPTGMSTELEVQSLEELRIGHRTAAELRWIEHAEADDFYGPNTWSPEDRLEHGSRR